MRTFGAMERKCIGERQCWILTGIEPHVAIRLKAIFNRIPKSKAGTFLIDANDEMSNDLEWFESRYALDMTKEDRRLLKRQAKVHRDTQDSLSIILDPNYAPRTFPINGDLREYQARGVALFLAKKRLLNGDAVGAWKDPRVHGTEGHGRSIIGMGGPIAWRNVNWTRTGRGF